ncbi:chemotaxis protein CheW [Stenotrophomonas sp. C3(2023)]|uniref:chemotaxis protein CheW n=1 Tax=Stenotrophomonas sp. C3(2023) TaxID=3080277 RepID=UPI00293CF285|nr:chemotaxis protein CheW [Stenotrophomonas sp. C3(2023)]MDV3468810.1 chemotaxis protein CheW [Stenotrophomonas sp. C3(2023)]
MNATGVLDDYLEQLLGDAQPPSATARSAEPCSAAVAVGAEPDREPTWDDLPDDVIYETDSTCSAEPRSAAPGAEPDREPTWDDLPDEVIHETGSACSAEPGSVAPGAEPDREPTWDDLPDEVIYETHGGESTALTNADSPALEAAFSAAAAPASPATAPVPAPSSPAVPPPAPAARAPIVAEPIAASPHAAVPAAQPTTWQELQAQAHRPTGSQHLSRRSTERSSRWLRLRCGSQAYALELLKVQEVVLPVPLLPLRGTARSMLGIMNLRGQVVPVMDLGLHLGGAAAQEDAQTRIVVLEEHGEIMGLRVSAVEDVTNLADSQIEPPDTARICRISNDVFRGVARLQQRPMILLDATRLLS